MTFNVVFVTKIDRLVRAAIKMFLMACGDNQRLIDTSHVVPTEKPSLHLGFLHSQHFCSSLRFMFQGFYGIALTWAVVDTRANSRNNSWCKGKSKSQKLAGWRSQQTSKFASGSTSTR